MPQTRIADVLREVFRTYGFDTTTPAHPEGPDGATHRVDLLAEKAGLDIVVLVHEGEAPMASELVTEHARIRTTVGARYALAATLRELTPAAEEAARATGTLVWDRAAIERAIGRAVLLEASGESETGEAPIADLLSIGMSMEELPAEAAEASTTHEEEDSTLETRTVTETDDEKHFSLETRAATETDEEEDFTLETRATAETATEDATENAPTDDAAPMWLPSVVAASTAPAPTPASTPPPAQTVPPTRATPIETPDDPPAPVQLPAAPRPVEQGRGWYLQTSAPPPERLADPNASKPLPPGRQRESGREWFLETAATKPPVVAAESEPAARYAAPHARTGIPDMPGPDPHTFHPEEGVLLAPLITKETAAATAKRQVFTVDHTRLRYVPKRVMRWQVEASVEGRAETTMLAGTLLVDLAARTIEPRQKWETPRALKTGTFDVPVEGKPIRMQAAHAQELVAETILEETSHEVKLQDHDPGGDFQIIVKRRVRVNPADVKLTDEGVHWCPVWVFTGTNGETEIDGLTGNVLAAHLKSTSGATMVY